MQTRPETLLVRQHERVKCNLRAHVRAAPEFQAQVRLARTLGDGSRIVPATAIDFSPGGIGINSPVYFPRAATVIVRITSGDASAGGATLYEGPMQIKRCTMIGCEPTYYLGVSFVSRPEQPVVDALLDAARRSAESGPPAKGAAVA